MHIVRQILFAGIVAATPLALWGAIQMKNLNHGKNEVYMPPLKPSAQQVDKMRRIVSQAEASISGAGCPSSAD